MGALRRIVDGLLMVAMVAGVYLRLPRLGGWAREAAALGHARLAFGGVLASLDARLPLRLAFRVTLASFLVSHVMPAGLVTGSALNIAALEIGHRPGHDRRRDRRDQPSVLDRSGPGSASLPPFGRHLPAGYVAAAGLALALVSVVLAVTILMGAHPSSRSGRTGAATRWRGTCARASTPDAAAGPAAGWRR